MATAFSEFRTVGTDLVANIQAAILASSDWSRPNSGSRPNTLKATTTRGVQMVLDLADVAATVQKLSMGVYDAYDGSTLGNKLTRYLWGKRVNAGTLAANYYYVTVSAGKEHLFIGLEGPRAGDANPDVQGYGSVKHYFFLCDLVPYYDAATDPNACVIQGGSDANNASGTTVTGQDMRVWSSKSKSGAPWTPGYLATLDINGVNPALNRIGLDGNTVMSPFVLFDDQDGMRGRLSTFYYMGTNYSQDPGSVATQSIGSSFTKDGTTYKILAINRTDGNETVAGSLGWVDNGTTSSNTRSTLVAIPTN